MATKIEIELVQYPDQAVILLNDGERSVPIGESVSALDFHLAKNALHTYGEMLNRHHAAKHGKEVVDGTGSN